jgi:S-formylglutathione hydrolase FrmB
VKEIVVSIEAPSLEGNLLHEPQEQFVQIYLPPSYEGSDLNYPVIYYLPGFGSVTQGDNDYFPTQELAAQMSAGEIKEMILVVPNGANVLDGSFYVNSPVTGNWEDFILQDVIGYVDENYRTIPEAAGRGIAGFSMGGFSAIDLAMRYPDIFSAAYGMSPALFDKKGMEHSIMFDSEGKQLTQLQKLNALAGLSPEKAVREMIHFDGPLGFTVAYGAAFAPNPEMGAPYFDYPVEEQNGAAVRIPEIWERWENGFGGWNWKVEHYYDNLASLSGIGLDYGSEDLVWIREGSEYLSDQLAEAGIAHQVYVYEGGHGAQFGERIFNKMLPFFDERLVDAEP